MSVVDSSVQTLTIKGVVQGHESEVLEALGIDWRKGRPHINCPYPEHVDRHPSWRWGAERARAFCTCLDGTDDIFDVVMKLRACDFVTAKLYVAEVVGLDPHHEQRLCRGSVSPATADAVPATTSISRGDRGACAALNIWRTSQPAIASKVEVYLRHRAINIPVPPSLRFHQNLMYKPAGIDFPAMVAGVQGPDSKIQAIHRTYLLPSGRGKAQVNKPKMALGPIGNGAVRLAKAGTVLGLAEGIETALSAMQLFDIPCWAALGSRLDKVELPDMVRHVVVYADNGRTGDQISTRAAKAITAQGRKATLRFPPEEYPDWNDVLRAKRSERTR